MNLDIQKKPQKEYLNNTKLSKTSDVIELSEVQEIKDAIQEHLLFIGLDRTNNIRKIDLLGVGNSAGIFIDSKDILRTALLSASDNVILVHNQPSNSLKASSEDIHISNVINKFLKIFNIQLVDHIIVTENGYISMNSENKINRGYEDNNIKFVENTLLLEENNNLKKEIDLLKEQQNVQTNDDMEL